MRFWKQMSKKTIVTKTQLDQTKCQIQDILPVTALFPALLPTFLQKRLLHCKILLQNERDWTRWNQWKNTFLPMYCVVYWPCCEILLKWYIEFFQHWIHGLCRWLLFCYRSFHKLLTQKRHTCKYNWQWTGFHSIVLFYAVLCVIQISSKSCIQKIFQNFF